ncbi:early activation antigen CD69-like [Emydura macquarii macquarii]|uniref:early activation antigen CD69-like n=1 Tax=Emydura macquarii macquarii TaxID=1129001 RepID=UPI003529D446
MQEAEDAVGFLRGGPGARFSTRKSNRKGDLSVSGQIYCPDTPSPVTAGGGRRQIITCTSPSSAGAASSLHQVAAAPSPGSAGWLKQLADRCGVSRSVLGIGIDIGIGVVVGVIVIIIGMFALPAKQCEPCPATPASPVSACLNGWVGYLWKCYYFSEAEADWTSSQSKCSTLGASLTGIDTKEEMGFMKRYKGPESYWIGLHREPGQPWKWTSGTEFNNWFPIAGEETCAFMIGNNISSSSCSKTQRWICSK